MHSPNNLIIYIVWSLKAETKTARGWRRSASATLLNHLADCEYTDRETRFDAFNDPSANKTAKGPVFSPNRPRRVGRTLNTQIIRSSSAPIYMAPEISATMPIPNFSPTQSTPLSLTIPGSSVAPTPLGAQPINISPSFSPLPGMALSPLIFSNSPPASSNMMLPPSVPALRRTSSRGSLHSPVTIPSYMNWTYDRQRDFERRIARLTASAGLSLSWVENPEFMAFVDEFIGPFARVPSRRILSRRVIPELVTQIHKINKTATSGAFATLQADGWTGINHHHLIALMITANNQVCVFSSALIV